MELADKVADMTIRMEQGEVDRQQVYTLLLQCLLELRRLNQRISVLESDLGYPEA